jgi:hypothetical protein
MTPLHKPVQRVCAFTKSRGRKLIVTLAPGDLIEIRELRGKPLTVTVQAVWDLACRAEAREQQKLRRRGRA